MAGMEGLGLGGSAGEPQRLCPLPRSFPLYGWGLGSGDQGLWDRAGCLSLRCDTQGLTNSWVVSSYSHDNNSRALLPL